MGLLISTFATVDDDEDALTSQVAQLQEMLARLNLSMEQQKQETVQERQEKERALFEKEQERQEKERALSNLYLQSLMSETSIVIPGVFSISVPVHCSISVPALTKFKLLVRAYNSDPLPSTERSGSIDEERSVHYLWRLLLEIILCERDASDDSRDSEDRTRVVYEWEINCPRSGNSKYIDFAFTDAACSHLNWLRYRGGIELKKNPFKLSGGKKSGSGTANTIGQRQALSRAATCVYAFLEAAGWNVPSGGFRSYACYCDARTFAVARVSIDVNLQVVADVYGPISLPGFPGDDDSAHLSLVPCILKHLLTSPPDALLDLLSAPPPTNPTISGINGGKEVEWRLGQILGVGGFALVCCGGNVSVCEGAQSVSTVIKTATTPKHTKKLGDELKILQHLQRFLKDPSILAGVPRCVETLESFKSTSQEQCYAALRLTPLGVPVPKFLRLFDPSSSAKVYTSLVGLMGPALVRILHAAHLLNICHKDIRASNLLIVPSPAAVARIVEARGDLRSAPEAIKSINLQDSTFVLNDWGEAKKGQSDEGKIEDLQSLVVALTHLTCLLDVSSVSVTKGTPVSLEEESSSGSRTYSTPYPCISTEAIRKLLSLAEKINYDEMIKELGSVQFLL